MDKKVVSRSVGDYVFCEIRLGSNARPWLRKCHSSVCCLRTTVYGFAGRCSKHRVRIGATASYDTQGRPKV